MHKFMLKLLGDPSKFQWNLCLLLLAWRSVSLYSWDLRKFKNLITSSARWKIFRNWLAFLVKYFNLKEFQKKPFPNRLFGIDFYAIEINFLDICEAFQVLHIFANILDEIFQIGRNLRENHQRIQLWPPQWPTWTPTLVFKSTNFKSL